MQKFIRATLPLILFLACFMSGFYLNTQLISNKLLLLFTASIWGLGSIILLYYALQSFVEALSYKIRKRIEFLVFIGPALFILTWYLVLPVIRTLVLSFMDRNGDNFVGLDNYLFLFSNKTMRIALQNNIVWLVIGTGMCVLLGLVVAILSDRVKYERLARTFVFMPLVISMVGAGIIWRFVYTYRPPSLPQIGLLNALVGLFGLDPINWLTLKVWNTLLLIIIFIWLQTGFAMVIFSSAIKGVSMDIIEAARVDGLSEFKIITKIIIPSISSTIITVGTTILLLTLKVFDIVYSITNGLFGTEVLASQQYKYMFRFLNFGQSSAIAILIFILVIPVLIYNLRNFKEGFK